MEGIRQYILSVCCAAILCGIIRAFFPGSGTFSSVMKLLTGMFLLIVTISPLIDIEFSDYEDFFSGITADAAAITSNASNQTNESIKAFIKQETETYILDKASSMGLDIQIQVDLDDSSPPVPKVITIFGDISPLARQQITEYLIQELDIVKENIIWK